jgi:hypothetical protein
MKRAIIGITYLLINLFGGSYIGIMHWFLNDVGWLGFPLYVLWALTLAGAITLVIFGVSDIVDGR